MNLIPSVKCVRGREQEPPWQSFKVKKEKIEEKILVWSLHKNCVLYFLHKRGCISLNNGPICNP